MSWAKLNNSELQSVRKMLMLDVSEAAEFIGKCSNRTWQYWESGRSTVPADVEMVMYGLIQIRSDLITEHKAKADDIEEYKMPYFHTFDLYLAYNPTGNKVLWRIHQSAAASVFSDRGNISLA